MFKVGTYVSYRAEGVCVISDIRNEAFNSLGKKEEFYYSVYKIHELKK